MRELSISELRQSARIRLTDQPLFQPEILRVGDDVIASFGNISASIGKAKAKKSFNVLAMIAASLTPGQPSLNYCADIPIDKRKIIIADTEQSQNHCLTSFMRLAQMANLPLDIHPDCIEFLALRRFSPKKRVAIIRDAILNTKDLGIVFIDGIRDLVTDINDSAQANWIICQLMEWTELYNIHCHVVLHQNKGDGNARGHLGTELVNKSETVLEVSREGDGLSSLVKPIFCRNKEFFPFRFFINELGIPELGSEVADSIKDKKHGFSYPELSEEQHRTALKDVFNDGAHLGYGDLITKLNIAYAIYFPMGLGINKTKSLKVFLENKRLIIRSGKAYVYNPQSVF